MRTNTRKQKSKETGEDLWAWAERRELPAATVREDPDLPAQPGWYRGILKKIAGQKA